MYSYNPFYSVSKLKNKNINNKILQLLKISTKRDNLHYNMVQFKYLTILTIN